MTAEQLAAEQLAADRCDAIAYLSQELMRSKKSAKERRERIAVKLLAAIPWEMIDETAVTYALNRADALIAALDKGQP